MNKIKMSQSKLSSFLDCPRCFHLSAKLGIKQPSGLPFLLNSKMDRQLKAHFDSHRASQTPPPEFLARGLDLIPLNDPAIPDLRNNFRGLRMYHSGSGFEVMGAVDDIFWNSTTKQEHIVDVKATAKSQAIVTSDDLHPAFRRQLDFYVWLAQKIGRPVHTRAFLYYCNSRSITPNFNGSIDFEISIIPYDTDHSWIEEALEAARECLERAAPPGASESCELCRYTERVQRVMVPEQSEGVVNA